MNNKKISFFIADIEIGGVEINLLNILDNLKKFGYEVTIAHLRESNLELKKKFSSRARLIKLNKSRMLFMLIPFFHFLRGHSSNIIVVSSFLHLCNLCILKVLFFKKIKIIFKVETNIEKDLIIDSRLSFVFFKVFKNFAFSKCDLILCSSNSLRKSLLVGQSSMKYHIKTLYNPIVHEKDFENNAGRVEHRFFTNHNNKIFITIGRLVESKGFLQMIDAFSHLVKDKKFENARLLIIGSGPLSEKLEKNIIKHKLESIVSIIPFNENFLNYLDASDVYVSNSFYEGLNNNLVHALSKGKKIISTDCDFGPREILLDGKLGSLIKTGDFQELINAMKEAFLEEKINVGAMILRSKEFQIDNISKQFHEEVQCLI